MQPFVSSNPWPNSFDLTVTIAFLTLAVLVPAVGYVFMVLDVRAYLRSLSRGLIQITRSMSEIPDWARHDTPRAIAAFGLRMPCTDEDLMRSYRRLVKQLHPDHGGSERRFLLLQANFEEAMEILRRHDGYGRWTTRSTAM